MAKGCQYSKPSLKGFTHFASKRVAPEGWLYIPQFSSKTAIPNQTDWPHKTWAFGFMLSRPPQNPSLCAPTRTRYEEQNKNRPEPLDLWNKLPPISYSPSRHPFGTRLDRVFHARITFLLHLNAGFVSLTYTIPVLPAQSLLMVD